MITIETIDRVNTFLKHRKYDECFSVGVLCRYVKRSSTPGAFIFRDYHDENSMVEVFYHNPTNDWVARYLKEGDAVIIRVQQDPNGKLIGYNGYFSIDNMMWVFCDG